uniref:Olfactory receptor n=1 Tax=Leptobrachium leishanense TaxID=445787 RepID=A0A8C5M6I9_9ANUR
MNNDSEDVLSELILIGLSRDLQTQRMLFVSCLVMYTLTICGNIILTCVIITSPHLHTPMYYFLCNLSFLDLFYSTSTVPKMLLGMISTGGRRISHTGCVLQMLISLFLGQTECILLAVMAYDRYIAICFPLRYMVIMSWKKCNIITITVWTGSFLNISVPASLKPFKFCKKSYVDHYFCEVIVLLKLVCGDTFFYEEMIFSSTLFSALIPFGFILSSYICIIRAVLKIRSASGRYKAFSTCSSHLTIRSETGRKKAFSTCASHLTVVFIFYGTGLIMYFGATKIPTSKIKFISLMYIVVTPMLNPMIYSLRNNDVKRAVKKILIKR